MVLFGLVALLASPGTVDGVHRDSVHRWEAADTVTMVIVVHGEAPPGEPTLDELRSIFLLRTRFWDDGTRIAPVNLPATSRLRDQFSLLALGRRTRDFADHWRELYFHGTQPPPVLASEEAVILYVARTRGAIGYVSPRALEEAGLPEGVRAFTIEGDVGQ